jgi:hypothetical protein
MNELPGIRSFLAQYFPVFYGRDFRGGVQPCVCGAADFRQLLPTLADGRHLKCSFPGGLALTWGVVQCNFMIARGRPQWVWPLAALLALCVVAVLPTVAFGPHPLSYGLSLLFPLLGLLLLNSKRHREMRQKLVEVRRLRQAMIAQHKHR